MDAALDWDSPPTMNRMSGSQPAIVGEKPAATLSWVMATPSNTTPSQPTMTTYLCIFSGTGNVARDMQCTRRLPQQGFPTSNRPTSFCASYGKFPEYTKSSPPILFLLILLPSRFHRFAPSFPSSIKQSSFAKALIHSFFTYIPKPSRLV